MNWKIPETEMRQVHAIRQDFAKAAKKWDIERTPEAKAEYEEALARRARAIRAIHREDGLPIHRLSSMFRCSKTVIRTALEDDDE